MAWLISFCESSWNLEIVLVQADAAMAMPDGYSDMDAIVLLD